MRRCFLFLVFSLAFAAGIGTRADEPQWSSPNTEVDMTYVPKAGDQAVIGFPRFYVVGTVGLAREPVYEWRLIHTDAASSLEELIRNRRPPSFDKLYDTRDFPTIRMIAAGTPVKLLARHTVASGWENATVSMPAFEAEVARGPLAGKRLFFTANQVHRVIPVPAAHRRRPPGIGGGSDLRAANAVGGAIAEKLRGALLLERDNRQFAIEQYKEVASYDIVAPAESKMARKRLAELGIDDIRTGQQKEMDRLKEALKKPAPRDAPEPDDEGPAPEPAAPPPARAKEKPTVRVLDSSWRPSATGNYVEVSCTVRNASQTDLKGLTATIIYRDENNKLIKSDDWHVGSLDAGESTTFTAAHQSDPRMHHYNVQFKAMVGFESVQLRTLKPTD